MKKNVENTPRHVREHALACQKIIKGTVCFLVWVILLSIVATTSTNNTVVKIVSFGGLILLMHKIAKSFSEAYSLYAEGNERLQKIHDGEHEGDED